MPPRLILIACAFGRRRHGAMFTAGSSRAFSIIFSHVFDGQKKFFWRLLIPLSQTILLSAKLMSQNLPFPADGGKTSERIERTEVQPPSGFFYFSWGKETLFKRGSRKKTGPRWRCATRAGTRLTAARSCYAGKRSLALVAAASRRALLRRGRPRPRGA